MTRDIHPATSALTLLRPCDKCEDVPGLKCLNSRPSSPTEPLPEHVVNGPALTYPGSRERSDSTRESELIGPSLDPIEPDPSGVHSAASQVAGLTRLCLTDYKPAVTGLSQRSLYSPGQTRRLVDGLIQRSYSSSWPTASPEWAPGLEEMYTDGSGSPLLCLLWCQAALRYY